MDNKRIVNLSDYELNKDEIEVLSKGLKFCPTPGFPDPGELRDDMDRIHRRLRQIAFYDEPLDNEEGEQMTPAPTNVSADLVDNMNSLTPFKHRKFKNPAKGRGPPGPLNLEAMVLCNERDLNKRPECKPIGRKNLTQREFQAIKKLKNNEDIIIYPADKGSAVVIQNRREYLREGYRQLSDTNSYRELQNDPTDEFRHEVRNVVEDMYQSGEIDQTVRNYLMEPKCRASRLYFLPKIHKGKLPPPGRPVVSGNGCPTEKISQFVDHFLNPTTKKIKSYIKDTTHFLKRISDLGEIPQGALLVTLDVEALYPNIPNKEGMEAAKIALNESRTDPDVKPSNDYLMKLLELVLTRNNFQFNGKHFLQIRGTAIGTKLAVGFSNNYMGRFEKNCLCTFSTNNHYYGSDL